MTLTANELSAHIGRTLWWNLKPGIRVQVKVVDVKQAYGSTRVLCVGPSRHVETTGPGVWVNLENLEEVTP